MANTLKCLSPVAYLTNSAANVFTPAASTIESIMRHIHLTNVDSASHWATLYIGATGGSAGGTEIAKQVNIPANFYVDLFWPAGRVMKSTDFLTGLADVNSKVTIEVYGAQKVID